MNKLFMRPVFLFVLSIWCLALCACTQTEEQKPKKTSVSASGTVVAKKEYDEHITGVIKSIDKASGTLVVLETTTASETVLTYTGITEAYNKYGDIKTVEQFSIGDIVEVYFLDEDNEIIRLQNSDSAWNYQDVRKFTIQREDEILKISDRRYQYDPVSLIVARNGKAIDMLTIDEQDTLSVQGIGSRIYSITVTKGHGYVRFRNYDQFVGGMVEIGYGIIRNVAEDMLLIVPEGTYHMLMEHGMLRAEKEITVEQGEELVIDLGAYQTEVEKTGRVYFMIEPEGAQLNINGVPVVYTEAVELSYGKNVIQVFRDGYTAYTGRLNVRKAYQVVKISLAEDGSEAEIVSTDEAEETLDTEEEGTGNSSDTGDAGSSDDSGGDSGDDVSGDSGDESSDDAEEDEDASEDEASDADTEENPDESDTDTTIEDINTETTETDSEHTITINSPADVKVYVNGDYIGKSPVSFEKVIGTFTVALSKKGYQTASYTLTMEDDGESSYLSFPNLTELPEE